MGGSEELTEPEDGLELLVPVGGRASGAELVQIVQAELAAAAGYAEAARAASTRRAWSAAGPSSARARCSCRRARTRTA